MIRIREVSHHYSLGHSAVPALQNISLDIAAAEMVAITGPSGSGKSTLLNVLGCLLTPHSGEVFLLEKLTNTLNDYQKSLFRRDNISFIFQSFNLLPVLSVDENVEYPLILQGVRKVERKKRVAEIVNDVGLMGFRRHRPDQLSGGQRQRVAIARALITDPKYVLADEPTANLDSENSKMILNLIAEMNHIRKTAFIFATHDANVYNFAHRMINMTDGRVI
ncbi:ABC transporter ATP-binding protein [Escherichia coli]|jgi:putative ABC transport system ATP-binding protein|uniref:ABC transporter ATP-binding protein n=4 Tax=Escherichia coli TaxID=562 RepID=A0AB74MA85_ECOLX|nr:ABC transporter ATP-binding protein [Escherichia coli]EER1407059.1 ABC transporter ATP-binding protein [Escherichia coli]EFE8185692.1 ABC transporter ATP-binding protein [Escherichia coli]EFE9471447.1 ATP-binding cassette domain-containing protein [Escherichia coli]EFG3592436.1 ABC transporter ATP-binding protein [Escherichia coli]EFK2539647.1 ABC transporter ATP-binding protein [Escherichia coli]